jgi:ubiquinol-cytochrome c reductase cytochrome c1 subunit
MIRLISIVVGLGFAFVVLLAFGVGAYTAATEGLGEKTAEKVFHEHPAHLALQSNGPAGTYNLQQLQRGFQVYTEVCAACHALKHVAFRDLALLGYTEAEVKAIAAKVQVPGIDPATGEANTRPGTPTDYLLGPYPNDIAASAANGGKIPPDLSLITKARHDGPAYVHSLITGYRDLAGYKNHDGKVLTEEFPEFEVPPGGFFNPYFASLSIGMPPPLTTDGQVTYADGTAATVDQMSTDVSAFLVWAAEPTLAKRNQTGWAVLGFLLFATILAWFAKNQVWSAIKPKRAKD